MMSYPKRLRELIEALQELPGIGPRQATRFAFAILEKDPAYRERASELLRALAGETALCRECSRVTEPHESSTCNICRSPGRDRRIIVVVEKDSDVEAFESAGITDSVYHVLGGSISALEKNSQERLHLKELFERVKRLQNADQKKTIEIIIATSNTLEGNQTATYIERILEPLKVQVTRLGRGLATGLEIEYADPQTLENALKNRK